MSIVEDRHTLRGSVELRDKDMIDRGLVGRVGRLRHRDPQILVLVVNVANEVISRDYVLICHSLCSPSCNSNREAMVMAKSADISRAREMVRVVVD